jgi:hypothetical protein
MYQITFQNLNNPIRIFNRIANHWTWLPLSHSPHGKFLIIFFKTKLHVPLLLVFPSCSRQLIAPSFVLPVLYVPFKALIILIVIYVYLYIFSPILNFKDNRDCLSLNPHNTYTYSREVWWKYEWNRVNLIHLQVWNYW